MAAKILLLENVEKLGKKGEIATVRPGYAYNFLLPQGKALLATKDTLRKQARLQEEQRKHAEEERKKAETHASELEGKSIHFEVRVDSEGHMYGSVSSLDILRKIEEMFQISLEKRVIKLDAPIKETGMYDIPLRLNEAVELHLHVIVAAEGTHHAE